MLYWEISMNNFRKRISETGMMPYTFSLYEEHVGITIRSGIKSYDEMMATALQMADHSEDITYGAIRLINFRSFKEPSNVISEFEFDVARENGVAVIRNMKFLKQTY